MKPSGRALLGMSSSVSEPVGVGMAVEMVEVRAAEGTDSAILVTEGAEVTEASAAWVLLAAPVTEACWTGAVPVAMGMVELEAEPEGAAEPVELLEPEPVEGPEEPDEAPSQRAGPGIS